MKEHLSTLVSYDEHGLFSVEEGALMVVPAMSTQLVAGGFDLACYNNVVCDVQANGACVNALCGHTLDNAACFSNLVCA